ncbi:MAG: hypothetical protein QW403_02385 [Candidatus Aenigmatarchaeota archaeon]
MWFLNNGKSQSSLLILIALVSVAIVILISNIFSSFSFQQRILSKTQFTKLTDYLDVLKGFSKQIALLSSHAAAKEIAETGGDEGMAGEARSWICNNDRRPPTVNEVRYFLGKKTKEFINNYILRLWIEDSPDIYFANFTCSNINVDEISVNSGKNDEEYEVNNFGSYLEVSFENSTVNSTNDVSLKVSQVRFWYMYRIFKEWARTTSYPEDVMNCISEGYVPAGNVGENWCDSNAPQAFRDCVENAAKKAVKELKNLFSDPYIRCRYTIGCICAGITPDCDVQYPCADCLRNEAGELCIEKIIRGEDYRGGANLLKKSGEEAVFSPVDISKRYLTFNVDADIQWCNLYGVCGRPGDLSIWGAISTTFSCFDTKYALSVS